VFSLSATSRLLPWIRLPMLLQCKLRSRHEIRANITKYSDLISEEKRILQTLSIL
jgi:hypothetical protein